MVRRTGARGESRIGATMLVAGLTILCAHWAAGQDLPAPWIGVGRHGEFETDRDAFTPSTTVTGRSIRWAGRHKPALGRVSRERTL